MAVPTGAQARVAYDTPVEDYAPYQPQTRCRAHPRAGTKVLAAWIGRRYDGGTPAATIRACDDGGTSEHKDGRAVDWPMDATRKADRREVRAFLHRLREADADGNDAALARRMGVMYVIWNDHMWASYDHFARSDYLSGSCPSVEECSATLRHRDHVHVSLSKPGARGRTSWYADRL